MNIISLFKSRRIINYLVVSISLVGIFFRFERFNKRTLWGDELALFALTSDSPNHSPELLQDILIYNMGLIQFPGDILLLWPFHLMFGVNKWGVAFPHIVLSIFGFFLFYKMCRLYLTTLTGFVVAFLVFSFNNTMLFHAFEIRPYSVLIPLSIATFLVMRYLVDDVSPSRKKVILFNTYIVFTLLFHLYGVLMLALTYTFHMICSRKETLLLTLLKHIRHYWWAILIGGPYWATFTFGFDTAFMHWDTFAFIDKGFISVLKGIVGNLVGARLLYIFLFGFVLYFFRHKLWFKQSMFVVILVIVPISFILYSCVANHYWFIQRLFIWVMPWFAFLLGWQWDTLTNMLLNKIEKT